MSGKTFLTQWWAKCGSLKSFYWLIWHMLYIYSYMLLFYIWCKSRKALCQLSLLCFVFLSGSHCISEKYYNHSVFLNILRCLNYTRPTLHCSIDNHIFFMTTPTRNIVYCLVLLAVKPVNLFLWVKVYVAFNDLRYLKILLWESKMSIKISSLKYMEYIQKTPTQYIPLIFLVGEHSVPYFK